MMTRRIIAATGLALLFATSVAIAQTPSPSVRVRGTIEKVDGQTLMVKSRDGTEFTVKLADNARITAMVKASLADIKTGSFIGVTGMPQPDGSQKATAVIIFPEAMRGLGDGHRPWDYVPSSTMTNATVDTSVAGVDGEKLTVKYKDGEKTVLVTPTTEIATYAKKSLADLKPGEKIFIAAAKKGPDGTLEAPNVSFGDYAVWR